MRCREGATRLAQITGGKFIISVHAAELMPAFGVVDAIQAGTVECAHTASYYFVGKNKAFGFDATLPFGLNQRQQNAWMYRRSSKRDGAGACGSGQPRRARRDPRG